MSLRIGLFHATLNAIPGSEAAWQEAAVPVSLSHYLDEGLLTHVRDHGLDQTARQRFQRWLELIAKDGVAAILTTCSSLSPIVPKVRSSLSCPVIAIDDAMIDEALQIGSRIGVVATLRSAAETTSSLLTAAASKPIQTNLRVASGAFEALRQGDAGTHDHLVQRTVRELTDECDVVVLAQISMARVLPHLGNLPAPVLASGPSAVRRTLLVAQSALQPPR